MFTSSKRNTTAVASSAVAPNKKLRSMSSVCDKIPSSLLAEVKAGNVICFVGAGFSIGAGFPTWQQLLQQLMALFVAKEVDSADEAKGLGSSLPSQWAQMYLRIRETKNDWSSLRMTMTEYVHLQLDLYGHSCDPNLIENIKLKFSGAQNLEEFESVFIFYLREVVKLKKPDLEKHIVDLDKLISTCTNDSLDQAAQILEDNMTQPEMVACIRSFLEAPPHHELGQTTEDRLEFLRQIPFKAILTTNFDTLLGGVSIFHDEGKEMQKRILRDTPKSMYEKCIAYANGEMHDALQIHGSVGPNQPCNLVFTRQSYRNMIHGQSSYMPFLQTVMAKYTILFIGYSFSDNYMNHTRSSVLSMLTGDSEPAHPNWYAIVPDRSETDKEFFRKHEGIEFINYTTGKSASVSEEDHSGFDTLLQQLSEQTSPLTKWASRLRSIKVLYVDNEGSSSAIARKLKPLVKKFNIQVDIAMSVDEATSLLRRPENHYSIIVTRYSWFRSDQEPITPFAVPILRLVHKMRTEYFDSADPITGLIFPPASAPTPALAPDRCTSSVTLSGEQSPDRCTSGVTLSGEQSPDRCTSAITLAPAPPTVVVYGGTFELEKRKAQVMSLGAACYAYDKETLITVLLQILIPDDSIPIAPEEEVAPLTHDRDRTCVLA